MPEHEDDTARDNVVSMERLRERRKRGQASTAPPPREEGAAQEAVVADFPGDSAEMPKAEGRAEAEPPVPGTLYWLHCPTCGTLEYTELAVPGGRKHKCGTVVEEAAVDIDARAEMTVAEINLRRVAALETYLQQQRTRFEEYRHRLGLIAGEVPKPYSLTEERVKALPAAEVDPLGLIISDALNNPAKRFKKKD